MPEQTISKKAADTAIRFRGCLMSNGNHFPSTPQVSTALSTLFDATSSDDPKLF